MEDHEQEHEEQRDPTPPKNPHDEDKDEDSDDGGDKKTKNLLRYLEEKPMQGNPLSKKKKNSGSVFGDKRNMNHNMGLGESGAKHVGAKSNDWGYKFVSGSVASSGSGESLFGRSSGSGSVLGDKRNRASVQDEENGDGRVDCKINSDYSVPALDGSGATYGAQSNLSSAASSRSNVGIGGFRSGKYGGMSNVIGGMRNILGASRPVSKNIGGVGSGGLDIFKGLDPSEVGDGSGCRTNIFTCPVCSSRFREEGIGGHMASHAREAVKTVEAIQELECAGSNLEGFEVFLGETGGKVRSMNKSSNWASSLLIHSIGNMRLGGKMSVGKAADYGGVKCEHCHKEFQSNQGLSSHKKVCKAGGAIKEIDHECNICGLKFKTSQAMGGHKWKCKKNQEEAKKGGHQDGIKLSAEAVVDHSISSICMRMNTSSKIVTVH
ncbi:hypothetical protein ACLB2K_030609 [Fragaria x ananassa]